MNSKTVQDPPACVRSLHIGAFATAMCADGPHTRQRGRRTRAPACAGTGFTSLLLGEVVVRSLVGLEAGRVCATTTVPYFP